MPARAARLCHSHPCGVGRAEVSYDNLARSRIGWSHAHPVHRAAGDVTGFPGRRTGIAAQHRWIQHLIHALAVLVLLSLGIR